MITHWTTDFSFEALTHKLGLNTKYIILEADTQNRLAFDVNKFREINEINEVYTKKEDEIIFPIYRKHIKEFFMTINDFKDLKMEEKDKKDN
jgi:hypothetical protein